MSRIAHVSRITNETRIQLSWDLDTPAPAVVSSGIGFLDHMLNTLATHSRTGLELHAEGDLHIDGHHTTEDIGIVLGQGLRQALGERRGVERFGHMQVPLDEALVAATIDLSGRPCLVYQLDIPAAMLGSWDSSLVREFFAALADNARCCIHLHQICGSNGHHIVEAAFKAFARALRQAIVVSGSDTPSTKGMLA